MNRGKDKSLQSCTKVTFNFMPEDIPVMFEYKGQSYQGELSPVQGTGKESGAHFYLIIDGFIHGQLFKAPLIVQQGKPLDLSKPVQMEWQFFSPKGEFKEMAEYFGEVVMAWYG